MESLLPSGYTYIKTIAQNHLRTVSLWVNDENNRKYAIKMYDKSKLMQNKGLVANVLNEKKALSEIDFVKINKMEDTFKDDKHIGLILELAKGISLVEILHSYHRVPSEIIKIVICQLVSAIEHLHVKGYVYKDLKASHVFISKNGMLTLIDLGMAEKLDEGQRSRIPAGTFHSMAPEILDLWESSISNDGKVDESLNGYDFNADLYALGILIHEMLIGKPPFGYLQATTSAEERLAYFEQVRSGIDIEEFKVNLGDKLERAFTETEEQLIDLMQQLLKQQDVDRLGAERDFETLKAHELFKDYDWSDEYNWIKNYFDTHKKTKLIKDLLDLVDTWGTYNDSDISDSEKLDEEQNKLFDDF